MTRPRLLAVWAAGRVLSILLLLVGFLLAQQFGWHFGNGRAHQSFLDYLTSWDATHYRRIAEQGYPTQLPLDAKGQVEQNSWAFLPVYPMLVRLVMLTGLPFTVAGIVVALPASAAATLVLHRLLRAVGAGAGADWAVVLFSFGPLAFVLGLPYAEGLFLVFWFAALLAAVRRRWLLMGVLGVVAALTRPGAIALDAVVLVVAVLAIVRGRRGTRPMPSLGELARMAVAAAAIGLATLAWPWIAAAVTGRADAYTATELSWWTGFVGRVTLVPFTPWFLLTGTWLGAVGAALVVLVVAGGVLVLRSRPVRRLGPELVSVSAGYAIYLFGVFLPQQSLFRVLLPLAPLGAVEPLLRTRRRRVVVLVVAILLQALATVLLWFLGYP